LSSTLPLPDITALVRPELERLNHDLPADLAPGSEDLVPLLEHVGRFRGKQLRPALVYLAAKAVGSVHEDHHVVAKVVELIHTATLVHDDILDGATLRRRLPTLNALHGPEAPVLLGDYIYARAFHMAVGLTDQTCSRVLSEVTRTICQGEITQILHRYDFAWNEERYLEVIRDKTASLYAAATQLGAHYAHAAPAQIAALSRFGNLVGIAFQIVDDCLDLDGDEGVVGKSLGTDPAKGKLTLPLLYLKGCGPADAERLRSVLQERDPHRCLVRLRAELPLEDGIAYAQKCAAEHVARAQSELAVLPATPAKKALQGLAEYVLRREH
jgi:octaprenyl-diphosphate synthase